MAFEEPVVEEAQAETDSIAEEDTIEEADQDVVEVEAVEEVAESSPAAQAVKQKTASLGLGDVVIPPLDETQKELVDTPVDKIPEEMLFVPVPLAARLAASNVTSVTELANRQRELIKTQATKLTTDKPPPPEIRFRLIDSAGAIVFKFTTSLDIPAGTEDRIKEQLGQKSRLLESDSEDDEAPPSLFEAFAVYAEESDES